MITPFKADGSVNYETAKKLASHLVDRGSDTILLCGTTGESPALTREEEYQLFQEVKAAIAPRGKVLAGTGSNSTKEAISATREAAKLGIDGTLQVVPYYNKPPQAGLYEHFKAIAKACPDLPIILYNIPSRTGRNLESETTIELAKIDNIIGIKEASGNLDTVSQIRASTPTDFAIYSGDDSLTLPLLAVGGNGVVSVASHLVGNTLQEAISSCEKGDLQTATTIHLKLFPLFKALFYTTNPIPIKTALNLQGWDVGGVRLPLGKMPAELEAKLKVVLEELELL
ncbi:MAG: 4-hydroxy-tetrahydrodipicolinate synthase [Cyanobacteria bacterium SBLK]|nr:4-hydroxy-tetrahydrodipicolinate synthase [Cyanobacteria bacterium SBLK]